jgi:multidrug transporter EmrE-like cation transporter
VLLSVVVRSIPVSVAYAVWAAGGTAIIALIGMTILGEPVNHLRVVSLVMVVGGIVGLNASGSGH